MVRVRERGQAGARAARRLVVKSPVHTARVRLLLELFPEAQFVFIHRDPMEVYRSAAHMADSTYWYSYLATPTDAEIQEFILNQYVVLYREYVAARGLIPEGSLHELSFDELQGDGMGAMRRLYDALGWGGAQWASAEPRLRAYLDGLRAYRKNAFEPLPKELDELVRARWSSVMPFRFLAEEG